MNNGNTVPTVITDKNGKITTVHKNPTGSVRKKRIPPAPSLQQPVPQNDEAEITAVLKSVTEPISGMPRFAKNEMREIAYRTRHCDNPKLVPSIIGLVQADLGAVDKYSTYIQLNIFRLTNNYEPLITAYENLDLLADGSGRIEHLFTLDNVLRLNFSRLEEGKDPVRNIREHYAAKQAYPHVRKADGTTKYEENIVYLTAVQTRPELMTEMFHLVNHSSEADAKEALSFEVLFGVHDEMPQEKERLNRIIQEHSLSDLIHFIKDRGVEGFSSDVFSAYYNTHGAVLDGLL